MPLPWWKWGIAFISAALGATGSLLAGWLFFKLSQQGRPATGLTVFVVCNLVALCCLVAVPEWLFSPRILRKTKQQSQQTVEIKPRPCFTVIQGGKQK